jgi:hypothetical protein
MTTPLIAYLFRDGHFAPAGNTVVCVAERAAVEAVLGRGQLEVLFKGGAVYTNDAAKLDYIGVWGVRNASRLRRLLRERGFDLSISRTRPPSARLRYFTHNRQKSGEFMEQRRLAMEIPALHKSYL